MADLYALVSTDHGLFHVELEIKTGKAKQTKEQKQWQSFIESMGGIYILCRDIKTVIDELKRAFKNKGPLN